MSTRIEITQQLKGAYQKAKKGEKGKILDSFCASTGLSRSTARRYLTSPTLGNRNAVRKDRRRNRATKYSAAAKEKLFWLWRIMCQPCGKYLVANLPLWIPSLEAHGELKLNEHGWSSEVRQELLSMSAATVDRYLKNGPLASEGSHDHQAECSSQEQHQDSQGGDEISSRPGFLRWIVAHCSPYQGEYARTLTLTDVLTGCASGSDPQQRACSYPQGSGCGCRHPIGARSDCDNGSELMATIW